MMTSLFLILLACAAVLIILMTIAVMGERRYIPERWITSPLAYILSLGIAAGGIFFYGAISYAHDLEFGYFYFYFGMSSMFILGLVILKPIYKMIQIYRFENLVDLLSFRFRHPLVGPSITIMMLVIFLPLIASQLSSVTMSIAMITSGGEHYTLPFPQKLIVSLFFAVSITTFNFVLSSYRINRRQRNNGLIAMVALETLIRLFALSMVAILIIWGVFNGFGDMSTWASEHYIPAQITRLIPLSEKSLLLMSFATPICLPYIFHMIFGESSQQKAFDHAFWGLPLLLLLFSLPLLPIVWGGAFLTPNAPPTTYLLQIPIALDQSAIQLLILIARVCTYFSVTVVICMVTTTALINYVILPVFKPSDSSDSSNLSDWILRLRRTIGTTIMLLAWLTCLQFDDIRVLYLLSVAAICIFCQLLPGVLACLFFSKASSRGFLAGLALGITSYIYFVDLTQLLQCMNCDTSVISSLQKEAFPLSILLNFTAIFFVSLLLPRSQKDILAAKLSRFENVSPSHARLATRSADDFVTAIAPLVGYDEAQQQIHRALNELDFDVSERRPFALMRLRELLERNLAEKLGLSIAQNAINQLIPYTLSNTSPSQHYGDEVIDQFHPGFTGIAGELDRLRRFHRQTLARLPVGVCYISSDNDVVLWNNSLEQLTSIETRTIEGAKLDQLAEPWRALIDGIISEDASHFNKVAVEINGSPHWLTIHKEKHHLDDRSMAPEDHVLVIEDVSAIKTLEDELIHTERLASIGRLAAGVAHEIGNPVTGIACLAQNLKLDSDEPDVLDTAAEIINQTARISSIMESLISFSHAGKVHVEYHNTNCDLATTLYEAIKLSNLDPSAINISIVFEPQFTPIIFGDEQRLLQVFLNLIKNARDASAENEQIIIGLSQNESMAIVSVSDNGTGISQSNQEKIFEPFFTTKDAGQGTGLGLALAFSIIEDHKGSIKVISPLHKNTDLSKQGTQFIIKLPLVSEQLNHRLIDANLSNQT